MFIRKLLTPLLCSMFMTCALLSLPALSQDDQSPSQAQNDNTVEGTIVSSSRTTFVVKSDDNKFHLFTFDRSATKPRSIAVGARVRVTSTEGDQAGAREATNVETLEQAPHTGTAHSSPDDAAPLPPSVHNAENQIQREARRWRMGVRGGVALDPELVMFGLHSQMGPIFRRNVFFRPNAEFAWGEVTDLVALNLEGVYRMAPSRATGAWAPYIGGGPALNFIHQSFATKAGQGRDIQFGNFDYETGFNILMGFQNRTGTFFEIKTSLYSAPAPVLRLIVGKNF
ncbi:MAG TPA: hypothetical protein VGG26_09840 [Terracidiphilus sp.]|jgi:hypothetical protein